MQDTYTIILDVDGGTYVDQHVGATPRGALLTWGQRPHAAIMSAFQLSNVSEFYHAVEASTNESEQSIVPLSGVQSVWFLTLQVNKIEGYLNVIKTKLD